MISPDGDSTLNVFVSEQWSINEPDWSVVTGPLSSLLTITGVPDGNLLYTKQQINEIMKALKCWTLADCMHRSVIVLHKQALITLITLRVIRVIRVIRLYGL